MLNDATAANEMPVAGTASIRRLTGLLAAEHSRFIERLKHEYALKEELDADQAARTHHNAA